MNTNEDLKQKKRLIIQYFENLRRIGGAKIAECWATVTPMAERPAGITP